MPGSDPNEEGLRAIGRAVDASQGRRPRNDAPPARRASPRAPAHAAGRSGPRAGAGYPGDSGYPGYSGYESRAGDRRAGPARREPGVPVASSRGGSGSGGGSGRSGPPGPPGPSAAGAPRRRKRRWIKRTVISLAVLIVLVVAAGAGYGYYLDHEVHRVTVGGLSSGTTTGGDANTENILMVGSTTRCGLAKQTPAYGLCTQGVTGVNSDVIMILHLNPNTKTVSILSVPRDLFIPNARKTTGAYKVDAALAEGPTQLVAAIEEDFGIPIQHYVELNFDTFAAVVTALGGITMDFPVPVFDRESGLKVFTTGCHHLNGVQALQVVRARHLQYWVSGDTPNTPSTWPQEAQSDLARIVRDHEFLRVLAAKVAARGLGDPATDLSLINGVAPHLTVDSGLSASAMVNLVLTYHSVNVNQAPQLTMPVVVGTFGTYVYQGGHFGDVEFPIEPTDQSVVDQFLGLGTDTSTMTGKALPAPSAVSVSVLDGTDTYGQATQTSTALGHLGFHMVGTGSTTPVGTISETLVTYSQRTPTDEAAAELVADSLSGSVILHYGPTADGADVTVTTGSNFTVDPTAPAPSSTNGSSTTAPTTTTTTKPVTQTATHIITAPATGTATSGTTTTTTTPNFTTPSSSNPPLAAWDPRACPAGQTGNSGNW